MAIVRRYLGAKLEIVADLAVEHSVPPGSIYQWVQRLLDNGDLAIEKKPRAESQAIKQAEEKTTAFATRLANKNQVIAELSTEWFESKDTWGPLSRRKVPQVLRDEVVQYVESLAERTDRSLCGLLQDLGLGRQKYFKWVKVVGQPVQHNGKIPKCFWLDAAARNAVL